MSIKSELRMANHDILPGVKVIEIWYNGEFIGQVTGADGPGIRLTSKYQRDIKPIGDMITDIMIGVD